MSELHLLQPITVVTQVIHELEAQGVLMLFDQHDRVAERLTDDLLAAGVLQRPIEQNTSVPPPSSNESVDV